MCNMNNDKYHTQGRMVSEGYSVQDTSCLVLTLFLCEINVAKGRNKRTQSWCYGKGNLRKEVGEGILHEDHWAKNLWVSFRMGLSPVLWDIVLSIKTTIVYNVFIFLDPSILQQPEIMRVSWILSCDVLNGTNNVKVFNLMLHLYVDLEILTYQWTAKWCSNKWDLNDKRVRVKK